MASPTDLMDMDLSKLSEIDFKVAYEDNSQVEENYQDWNRKELTTWIDP